MGTVNHKDWVVIPPIPTNEPYNVVAYVKRDHQGWNVTHRADLISHPSIMILQIMTDEEYSLVINLYNPSDNSVALLLSTIDLPIDAKIIITGGFNLHHPVSQTQITTQDVTQLYREICDIKEEQIINRLADTLSKVPSNTPGQWDICDKHAPSYAKNAYNKLCPVPPNDNHDSPTHRDSSLPPGPSPSAQTPPGPPPVCTPSPAPRTSVGILYVTVAPGSGELPSGVENRARNSPCKS